MVVNLRVRHGRAVQGFASRPAPPLFKIDTGSRYLRHVAIIKLTRVRPPLVRVQEFLVLV